MNEEEVRVAIMKGGGGVDYAVIKWTHIEIQPDARIVKDARTYLIVVRDALGIVAGSFNEKALTAVFRGECRSTCASSHEVVRSG